MIFDINSPIGIVIISNKICCTHTIKRAELNGVRAVRINQTCLVFCMSAKNILIYSQNILYILVYRNSDNN